MGVDYNISTAMRLVFKCIVLPLKSKLLEINSVFLSRIWLSCKKLSCILHTQKRTSTSQEDMNFFFRSIIGLKYILFTSN